LYLLRQLRSRLHRLSTHTLCRSFSLFTSRLELQHSTIWTLSDQDSSQSTISHKKRLAPCYSGNLLHRYKRKIGKVPFSNSRFC
ncbi:hypothetical protein BD770DRAFT_331661, partial [Pilaira anomala]